MNQTWVRNYVESYLEKNQCRFIEREKGHTTVKLSVETDKDLTNRPYYWTFVERTGAEPEPLTLTFIFDKNNASEGIRGEEIRFGSERLKQIFHSAKKRGRMARLFEQTQGKYANYHYRNDALNVLYPWLGVNYKIEFISYKKKDKIISLGINLASGEMKDNFLKLLNSIDLTPALPANITITQPYITFREAALQFDEWLLNEINKENFDWVIESNERLKDEIEQLDTYYLSRHNYQKTEAEKNKSNNLYVEKEKRIEELSWQYAPKVEVSAINYGLFYISNKFR